MFTKKTVRDIDLSGKTVLLRADYNVPLDDKQQITSDYRMQKSLPTLQYLLDQKCKIIICSHLGRPEGPNDHKTSLLPVAKRLGEMLKQEVKFAQDCIGPEVTAAAQALQPGEILLLENVRYHPEEEKNDPEFAKQLAALAEVYVQDGFGVVHRAHASTEGVAHYLPAVAGLLLEQEVDTITNVMDKPKRPLMAIIGGAKIQDKIEILNKFIDIADVLCIGGAMANTFLFARGINVGKSLVDKDDLDFAREIMDRAQVASKERHFVFYLPQDGIVAKKVDQTQPTRIVDWDAHMISEVESYPKNPPPEASQIAEDELILDIGPFSGAFIAGSMQMSETVIWNGTMGVTEIKSLLSPVGPYAHGTEVIIESLLGQYGYKPFSVIGGGDTSAYIEDRKLTDSFNHVSTGGGASLELMAGKVLPGVAALLDKDAA